MKKKKTIKNKVMDPQVQYQSLPHTRDSYAITFNAHQKKSEEIQHYQANLTPEKRMHDLYQLICVSFGLNFEELRNPKLDNIIVIENPDEHFS